MNIVSHYTKGITISMNNINEYFFVNVECIIHKVETLRQQILKDTTKYPANSLIKSSVENLNFNILIS